MHGFLTTLNGSTASGAPINFIDHAPSLDNPLIINPGRQPCHALHRRYPPSRMMQRQHPYFPRAAGRLHSQAHLYNRLMERRHLLSPAAVKDVLSAGAFDKNIEELFSGKLENFDRLPDYRSSPGPSNKALGSLLHVFRHKMQYARRDESQIPEERKSDTLSFFSFMDDDFLQAAFIAYAGMDIIREFVDSKLFQGGFLSRYERRWRGTVNRFFEKELKRLGSRLASNWDTLPSGPRSSSVISIQDLKKEYELPRATAMAQEIIMSLARRRGLPLQRITVIVAGLGMNLFEAEPWLSAGAKVVCKECRDHCETLQMVMPSLPEKYGRWIIETPEGPTEKADVVVWNHPFVRPERAQPHEYSTTLEGLVSYLREGGMLLIQSELAQKSIRPFLASDQWGSFRPVFHATGLNPGNFFLPSFYLADQPAEFVVLQASAEAPSMGAH